MADRNGSTMRRRSRRKDELAETTGLRIESAWRNSHGSRQEAQRRKAQRSHIPIPTNRNRHADRRTQSLYPGGETKHNQDPLTNRGMGRSHHRGSMHQSLAERHCRRCKGRRARSARSHRLRRPAAPIPRGQSRNRRHRTPPGHRQNRPLQRAREPIGGERRAAPNRKPGAR